MATKRQVIYDIIVDNQFEKSREINIIDNTRFIFSNRKEDKAILAVIDWIVSDSYFSKLVKDIESYEKDKVIVNVAKQVGSQLIKLIIDASNAVVSDKCDKSQPPKINQDQSVITIQCISINDNEIVVTVSGFLNGTIVKTPDYLQTNTIKTVQHAVQGFIEFLESDNVPFVQDVLINSFDVDNALIDIFTSSGVSKIKILAYNPTIDENCLDTKSSITGTFDTTKDTVIIDCIVPTLDRLYVHSTGYYNGLYTHDISQYHRTKKIYMIRNSPYNTSISIEPNSKTNIVADLMKEDTNLCKSHPPDTFKDTLDIVVKSYCFYNDNQGVKYVKLNNFINGNSYINATKTINVDNTVTNTINTLPIRNQKNGDNIGITWINNDTTNKDEVQPSLKDARKLISDSIVSLIKNYRFSNSATVNIDTPKLNSTLLSIVDGNKVEIVTIDTSLALYDDTLCGRIDDEEIFYKATENINSYCLLNNVLTYSSSTNLHYQGIEFSTKVKVVEDNTQNTNSMIPKKTKLSNSSILYSEDYDPIHIYILSSKHLL